MAATIAPNCHNDDKEGQGFFFFYCTKVYSQKTEPLLAVVCSFRLVVVVVVVF